MFGQEAVLEQSISTPVPSPSVHDRQAAIPLIKQTSSKADDLDHLLIVQRTPNGTTQQAGRLAHVHIINEHARGTEVISMASHEASTTKSDHLLNRKTADRKKILIPATSW
ncbi:MAG: hypothetical protein KJ804_20365 [Proteobacteria bacterium]|nr:hypothetical protein [Pseudomonadota bacterium]MBU1060664.1 hypothetical protein [Pseudomonadota bacterium]